MAFYVERKTIRKVPGRVIKVAPLPEPVINYSPPRTFSDSEIKMILDRIRRGY